MTNDQRPNDHRPEVVLQDAGETSNLTLSGYHECIPTSYAATSKWYGIRGLAVSSAI